MKIVLLLIAASLAFTIGLTSADNLEVALGYVAGLVSGVFAAIAFGVRI